MLPACQAAWHPEKGLYKFFLGHFERGFWPPFLHHHHLGLQGAGEGGSEEQIQGERRSAIKENIKELAGTDPTSLHHHI